MEVFARVPGYEGKYLITNTGSLWSEVSKKFLQPNTDKYGYKYYTLCVNGVRKTVKEHRLVAEAFIPNPSNYPQVNHKDENKRNNSSDNLEWCDAKYNDCYGTRNKRIGAAQKNHPAFSKKVRCVETGVVYASAHEASRCTGINRANIGSSCLGRKKHSTAGGYHWEFFTEVSP